MMTKLIGFLSIQCFLASPIKEDRFDRLRRFSDTVKAFIPESRVTSNAWAAGRMTMLENAMRYINHEGDSLLQGMEVMDVICNTDVSRRNIDDLTWEAIKHLCADGGWRASPESARVANDVTESALEEPQPTIGESNTGAVAVDITNRKRQLSLTIETGVTDSTSTEEFTQDSTAKRSRSEVEERRIEEDTELRSEESDPTDDEIAVEERLAPRSEKSKLKKKLKRILREVEKGQRPSTITDGMKYLSSKHARMALKGDISGLSKNLEILENVEAPNVNIAFLFKPSYEALFSETKRVGSQTAMIPERLKSPFSEAHFSLLVISPYCRDPRLSRRTSPTHDESTGYWKISQRLLKKAREGDNKSIQHTVEFLELAGVDKFLIGNLLKPACEHWMAERVSVNSVRT
jgi:hypothetical protein